MQSGARDAPDPALSLGPLPHYTRPVAIRVVCFDLGGVVVRIHSTWEHAAAAAGVAQGLPPKWGDRATVAAWQVAHLAHHRGELTSKEYFQRVAGLSEGGYSPEEVGRIHRAWLIGEYAGMADLVGQLSRGGLLTACLSNTNDCHWDQLLVGQAYPAVQALQLRLASHELRLLKPERAIYEAAQVRFACRPAEVAFFDDLPENVEAAKAAGWNAERIDPLGDPALQVRKALAAWGTGIGGGQDEL